MVHSPDVSRRVPSSASSGWLTQGSVVSALVAALGSVLVVIGSVAPWIKAVSGTVLGVADRTVSPSLTLTDLGAKQWTYVYWALAIVGFGAAWACQRSRAARRALLLIGIVTVILSIGIFHGHGYPISAASVGPALTLAGGLVFFGVAVFNTLRAEHRRSS